ncbi:NAD-P-binding protein [Cyathus striatus]|nr:NAD-P-binding protein [Cyathus striatus]
MYEQRPTQLILDLLITRSQHNLHLTMSAVLPKSHIEDIRSEKWDLNLIPDLTGKVALVTGAASSGSIGFHIAHQFALKGAKVYIGARSAARAEVAVKDMLFFTPALSKELLKTFVTELADLKQVKAACDKFLAEESRLDLLIHNAAMVSAELDSNGLSLTIAVNHLVPFIITRAFLPLLKAAAAHSSDVRVVTLSSYAYTFFPGPVRFDTKESLNFNFPGAADQPGATFLPYAHSKLANILFAYQLQKKLDEDKGDITSVSVHPGTVRTVGAEDFTSRTKTEHMLEQALTPLEGAITPLFAATAPEVRTEKSKFGGAFVMPFGVVLPEDMTEDAKNPKLAEELWNTSENVVVDIFGN